MPDNPSRKTNVKVTVTETMPHRWQPKISSYQLSQGSYRHAQGSDDVMSYAVISCVRAASARQRRAGVTPTTVVLEARTARHQIQFHPNNRTRTEATTRKRLTARAIRRTGRTCDRGSHETKLRRREDVDGHVVAREGGGPDVDPGHRTSTAEPARRRAQRRRGNSDASHAQNEETKGPAIPPPAPVPTVKMCKFRHVEGCTVCHDLYDHFTLPDGSQVPGCYVRFMCTTWPSLC